MTRVDTLPNLGPKSCAMLRQAGIGDVAALRARGAVEAYWAVRQVVPGTGLNLLWALEGALTGMHWLEVARTRRTDLLLQLDACMQWHGGGALRLAPSTESAAPAACPVDVTV